MPSSDIEDLWLQDTIYLGDLIIAAEFIKGLQGATLDNPSLGMSDEALQHLWNPPYEQSPRVVDKVTWLAIDLYVGTPSEATYVTVHKAILCFLPDLELLSYYKIKHLVADLTGIESVMLHMCVNFCIAYTGPFLDIKACPVCSEPQYDQFYLQSGPGGEKIPCQEFHTIPIGLQLQALYQSPESTSHAYYLCNKSYHIHAELDHAGSLDQYSDILHGMDLIRAFEDGCIDENDIVLMFSIDGAQLYAKKPSACWIYIWVLLNLSPIERYKKDQMFIGGFIPGPNNPKTINSFLFPGLQHLVALQKE